MQMREHMSNNDEQSLYIQKPICSHCRKAMDISHAVTSGGIAQVIFTCHDCAAWDLKAVLADAFLAG